MTTQQPAAQRKRMRPEERKRYVLEKAIGYFSDEGFDGGTRELAKRIGVTQALIFRYFPTKEDLVNEVYREVYLSQWNDGWSSLLQESDHSMVERLHSFYEGFTGTFSRDWMRIFFFAALRDVDIHKRYLMRVTENLLLPICFGVRRELGVKTELPISELELHLAWTMHGAVFHQGIREFIYGYPPPSSPNLRYYTAVRMYLADAAQQVPAEIARLQAITERGEEPPHFDPILWRFPAP